MEPILCPECATSNTDRETCRICGAALLSKEVKPEVKSEVKPEPEVKKPEVFKTEVKPDYTAASKSFIGGKKQKK